MKTILTLGLALATLVSSAQVVPIVRNKFTTNNSTASVVINADILNGTLNSNKLDAATRALFPTGDLTNKTLYGDTAIDATTWSVTGDGNATFSILDAGALLSLAGEGINTWDDVTNFFAWPAAGSVDMTNTTDLPGVLVGGGSSFGLGTNLSSLATAAGLVDATNNLDGLKITVGTVADARIATSITRDSEFAAALTNNETRSVILGPTNQNAGTFSSILGGTSNSIPSGQYLVIGGGTRNTNNGLTGSVIAGGYENLITGLPLNDAIGGGAFNIHDGSDYSVIGGGYANRADMGYYTFITGGKSNYINLGSNLEADGGGGILGGLRNNLSGKRSFILGNDLTNAVDDSIDIGATDASKTTFSASGVHMRSSLLTVGNSTGSNVINLSGDQGFIGAGPAGFVFQDTTSSIHVPAGVAFSGTNIEAGTIPSNRLAFAVATPTQVSDATNAAGILAITAQQTNYATLITMLGPLTNGLGGGSGSATNLTPWTSDINADGNNLYEAATIYGSSNSAALTLTGSADAQDNAISIYRTNSGNGIAYFSQIGHEFTGPVSFIDGIGNISAGTVAATGNLTATGTSNYVAALHTDVFSPDELDVDNLYVTNLFTLLTNATGLATGANGQLIAGTNGTLNFISDYSADNTGAADVSTELQQAINDAITQNKKLIIPGGTYLLNNPIVVGESAYFEGTIEGAGAGLTVFRAGTTNMDNILFLNKCVRATLKGFTLDGYNRATIGMLVGSTAVVSNVRFEDVTIKKCLSDGAQLFTAEINSFYGCIFEYNGNNGLSSLKSTGGNWNTDTHFLDCYFSYNTNYGFYATDYHLLGLNRCTIQYNHNSGIWVDTPTSPGVTIALQAKSCWIESNGESFTNPAVVINPTNAVSISQSTKFEDCAIHGVDTYSTVMLLGRGIYELYGNRIIGPSISNIVVLQPDNTWITGSGINDYYPWQAYFTNASSLNINWTGLDRASTNAVHQIGNGVLTIAGTNVNVSGAFNVTNNLNTVTLSAGFSSTNLLNVNGLTTITNPSVAYQGATFGNAKAQFNFGTANSVVITNGMTGFGYDNPQSLIHAATANTALPTASGTNIGNGGRIRIGRTLGGAVLDIGTAGGSGIWLSVGNDADLSTHYPLLLNPNGGSVVAPNFSTTTNAAVIAPNFALGGQMWATNAAFTFGLPLNISRTLYQTCVVLVTNSTAAAIAITPPASVITSGTWYCTNVTEFTFRHYGGMWTNAVASPLW